MKIIRAKDYKDMSRKAANIISAQGIMKPTCVLGLVAAGRIVGMGVGTIAAMIGVGRSIALVNYLGKQKMCLAAGLLQEEAPAGQEA